MVFDHNWGGGGGGGGLARAIPLLQNSVPMEVASRCNSFTAAVTMEPSTHLVKTVVKVVVLIHVNVEMVSSRTSSSTTVTREQSTRLVKT